MLFRSSRSLSFSLALSLSLSPLVLSPSTFIMLHHFSRMPSPCCIVSVQLLNVSSPLFIVSQHCSSLIALPVPTLDRLLDLCIFIYIYIRKSSFFEAQKQSQNKLFLRLKNNFFQSQKSSQKVQKESLVSNFLVTF